MKIFNVKFTAFDIVLIIAVMAILLFGCNFKFHPENNYKYHHFYKPLKDSIK